jgi:bifunctional DNA-binding transcriptional regulator/antitoxin component of YhaV-PrlF toxin-antitoxin module
VNVVDLISDDVVCIEETSVTVRSYRHRTTVPSKIFKFLDLKQGDTLRWIAVKDGTVYIRKVPEISNTNEE